MTLPLPDGFSPHHETQLGALVIANCLDVLRGLPDDCIDLVVTSPPYNEQPRYNDGQDYEAEWYEDVFLSTTKEVWSVEWMIPSSEVLGEPRFYEHVEVTSSPLTWGDI